MSFVDKWDIIVHFKISFFPLGLFLLMQFNLKLLVLVTSFLTLTEHCYIQTTQATTFKVRFYLDLSVVFFFLNKIKIAIEMFDFCSLYKATLKQYF